MQTEIRPDGGFFWITVWPDPKSGGYCYPSVPSGKSCRSLRCAGTACTHVAGGLRIYGTTWLQPPPR
ncbi:MAG: hypothetical protein ABF468_11065, partial [Acetobacter fabarum]|uniref:hypothetical protein n=1 Tax=Acetobacter fabarum TaxID=483199 RepID=UPI0039EB0D9D